MPILNWIGKDKVVGHHLNVPFYTLEHKYGFRADDEEDLSEQMFRHFRIMVLKFPWKKTAIVCMEEVLTKQN